MTAAPYPYPYGPPPAQPPADPGAVFRLLAAILGALAAVLVIAGSFLPQTSFEQVVDGKTESSQTISAWSRSFTVEPDEQTKQFYDNAHVARYGIPLTTAAVVLLAGAGLALAGARRSAGPGVRSAARTTLVAGAAGVAAAVWMLGMDVSATLSYESDQPALKSHYTTGIGFWLLIGSGIVALLTLVAAVLAGRRPPVAAPAGPPSGPYQQQSRPYPVPPQQYGQPYPGQPVSQPFPAQAPPPPQTGPQPPPYGGPASQPFPAQQPDDPYGGATQAQQHPVQQEPTEPNYQLPPLHPPKT
ncbi:hypothetical protein AMES_2449 [Amycolatopsis mediterranei S699]|uniref:Transmembrane protein n=2 Tax=Amycolatopsis mediterranei TaxID=33910 RepID=A0A0H3D1Z1_AMYMU|nr:hypothetical protein [Amycolatopsis mediterranei]ADJ44272.1 hypothetical protein AMED_2476 [Amycolatopsis mediterranei U32]AEK41008.1 hypothetical protein RAM_12590 [Amycolatopsis mediterranei S699]AFO75985.1 hypothetical protein AMES_2449 [Amycolatopsis mediterranei S699]AGT83114.1 hypothetical protein B737_2450 [Amycolatopsis mediterranei RB]KDO06811.1 hypothetical protein DV26_31940 [Amycolatopsis mediterranei]